MTKAGIELLIGQQSLRSLKIGGVSIDDEALAVVAKINRITTLSVDNCPVTDGGVARLGSLPLEELTIYQCTNVSDEGLRVLGSFANLHSLTLRDVKAHGASLALLPQPEKLVELNMAQSGITDAEVVHLTRFPRLESLTLSETAISDAAVDTLAKLTSLRSLTIAQTRHDGGWDQPPFGCPAPVPAPHALKGRGGMMREHPSAIAGAQRRGCRPSLF